MEDIETSLVKNIKKTNVNEEVPYKKKINESILNLKGDEIITWLTSGDDPIVEECHLGNSSLHIAVNSNTDVYKLFKQFRFCKLDVINDAGSTPLHYAAEVSSNLDVVTWLIDNGAVIVVQDKKSRTPMHIACKHGNTLVAKLLLERNANLESIDNKRYTLLAISKEESILHNQASTSKWCQYSSPVCEKWGY